MKKKLGIIGCGAVVKNQYVKALSMYHDVDVKYVFDLNKDLAADIATQMGANVVDKEELLKNSDIVIIATPPSTHYSLIMEAMRPGLRIISEKPFVGTANECRELIEASADRNAELYVAHFRRCFPSVQLARSIVVSGLIGDVTSIEAYEGGKFSWQTTSGYVYKDPYGGVLFDTGSHTIDMALFMANLDTVDFNAQIGNIKKDKEEPAHEVDAQLNLQLPDREVSFKVKLSRRLILSNKIRIKGTNGYIDVSVSMTNYLRLTGKNGSTIVYSNIQYNELMETFAVQFKHMFAGTDDQFKAFRFFNLTKILETIANN